MEGSSEVTLDTFLTWGRAPDQLALRDLVTPTLFAANADYTIHVGWWCVVGAGLSLLLFPRVRRPSVYWSRVLSLALLTLLSLGPVTPVAAFLYHWYPAMKYYRHIGAIVVYATMFGPLLAAWGVDAAVDWWCGRQPGVARRWLGRAVVASVFAFMAWDLWTYQMGVDDGDHAGVTVPLTQDGIRREAFAAYAPPFAWRRDDDPPSPRASALRRFIKYPGSMIYNSAFVLLGWDPCHFQYRWDVANIRVAELIQRRHFETNSLSFTDPVLTAWSGCDANKLRLLHAAHLVRSLGAGAKFIDPMTADGGTVILVDAGVTAASLPPDAPYVNNASLVVTWFSNNRLEADVDVPSANGAWLYYADAYHPHWRGEIDGVQRPVYPANHAFKAIAVWPGRSHVVFEYRATLVWFAMWTIIVLGLVWMAAGAWLLWRWLLVISSAVSQ